MYVRHFTEAFMNTPTDLVNGWLGAELVQSPGSARINEARYYGNPRNRRPFEMYQKPRSYTSTVHIKAAAISCGGCQTVRNYASFTCPMPPKKG
ncbi:hypothetical protein AAVH_41021 [Aphelenchoides avenae]|nr:hypothetical protein AAVH_41021 [Aphelenchus avenae]